MRSVTVCPPTPPWTTSPPQRRLTKEYALTTPSNPTLYRMHDSEPAWAVWAAWAAAAAAAAASTAPPLPARANRSTGCPEEEGIFPLSVPPVRGLVHPVVGFLQQVVRPRQLRGHAAVVGLARHRRRDVRCSRAARCVRGWERSGKGAAAMPGPSTTPRHPHCSRVDEALHAAQPGQRPTHGTPPNIARPPPSQRTRHVAHVGHRRHQRPGRHILRGHGARQGPRPLNKHVLPQFGAARQQHAQRKACGGSGRNSGGGNGTRLGGAQSGAERG